MICKTKKNKTKTEFEEQIPSKPNQNDKLTKWKRKNKTKPIWKWKNEKGENWE